MFFVLSRAWDKGKILRPSEESKLRPSDSALRCPTTESQKLHGERGLLPISYSSMQDACHINFAIDLAHCGVSVAQSIVEHRSAASEGLRFDSSWGLRIFSLSLARQKTSFSISLSSSKLTISIISTIITLSTLLILVSGMNGREQHCFLKRLSCRITCIDNSCYFVLLLQFFFLYFYVLSPWEFSSLGHAKAFYEFDSGEFSLKIYSTSVNKHFETTSIGLAQYTVIHTFH